MSNSNVDKILYENLTFPEVKKIVAEQRVVLLPVGAIEEHGPHAPIKLDSICCAGVCKLAAELRKNDAIVMPTVKYAYCGFNTNFPGTIHINEQNIIGYVADILFSLGIHGFRRIIIVNGHGGNGPFLNLAMRRFNVKHYPDAVACVINWWDLIPQEDLSAISDSEFGGMNHACELETSIGLYLEPELVQMDKAVKELCSGDFRKSAAGLSGTPLGPAAYVGWMGGMGGNKHGVMGDPTVATREKGQKWLNIAAESLAKFLVDWKKMPIKPVADHH